MPYHLVTDYDYPPYRPPSEGDSALIRATRGCPWNKCEFCTMYKDIKFETRPVEDVKRDVDDAVDIFRGAKTVFIADSDSLVMKDAVDIIRHIRLRFPNVDRVTSYARAKTLMRLGPEKLAMLKEAGLTRVHVGLESGDAETLAFMNKGAGPDEMIAGARAAKDAGLEVSLYVLIGAGGKERLEEHALGSARVCNAVNPDFIRLRTLIVQRGSLLEKKMDAGLYEVTGPLEKLEETRTFLEALEADDCEFASDHFTNNIWLDNTVIYRGVFGRLRQDKAGMLSVLDNAIGFLKVTEGEISDATILYEKGIITGL